MVDAKPDVADVEDLADLERLRFADAFDNLEAVIGLSTRFFVTDGHLEMRRRDAIAALRSYLHSFRHQLTHLTTTTGRARPLAADDDAGYFDSVVGLDDPDVSGLVLGLAGYPHEFSGYLPIHHTAMIGMSMPYWDAFRLYSDWSASTDFSSLSEPYPDALLGHVIAWASILRPRHGTSGVSFLFDQASDIDRSCRTIFSHLARHPGIDFDDGGRWIGHVGRRAEIRSTNWLNVVDDDFVAKLGGLEHLAARLGSACPIHRYDGGIVIQAGPRPEIGDVDHGRMPEHYRTVARVLKPLRFEDYRLPLILPPEPLDPMRETLRWIRRFD